MRLQLLFVVLFFAGYAFAFCGQPHLYEQHLREHPEAIAEIEELEERIANVTRVMMHERAVTNFRIPVVFHIFNPPSPVAGYPSVTDETVRQEMTWLNQWFSAANTNYLRSDPRWRNSKATADDFGITFELAAFDPQGRPTTGINRYTTNIATNGWCQASFYRTAYGGIDLWDVTRYYNIILCDLRGTSLGFAPVPIYVPSPNDAAVLNTANFGDPLYSGIILAHETGHYLNLYHTFEDCSTGDRVNDTPAHSIDSLTSGFPHCPPDQAETAFISNCPNVGNFMTQNIMNYNTPSCMSFFSKGQAVRMRAYLLTNPVRMTLPTSSGLATGGACLPSCSGRECGPDGCGGICGACTGVCRQVGVNNQCVTNNILCETATLVTINYNVPANLSTTIISTNITYTFSAAQLCSSNIIRNSRWYRLVPPHSNGVRIQITGTVLGTTLVVFTGSCTNLTCVASDFTGPMVNFCVTAGTTYYVTFGSNFEGATAVAFEYVPNVQCCTPVCDGRQCGDDGCGGFCGQCQSYQTCTSDFQCVGERPTPSPALNGPIIICPRDLVKTVSTCSYSGSIGIPQVIVPGGGSAQLTKSPKAPYSVGNTVITHVASANGYTATCTQRLTVQSSKNCRNDEK